jgi:hypothetical protein
MKITTYIRKVDLVRLNLSILPRMRSTYITIFVVFCLTFLFIAWNHGLPNTPGKLAIHVLCSVVGGVSGMLFGVIFNIIIILLMSSTKNGVLGEHTFTLLPEGLHEETIANEGLSKWYGVLGIRSVGSYLLVQVAPCLFHIIPKQSFDSIEQFENFKNQAINYWQQAQTSANT